jgi:hypothetical protein
MALVLLVFVPAARAQGVGFQGGFTIDPEQGYAGSHFETREIASNLRLRPSIDGALGSDLTLVAINVDLIYKYEGRGAWRLYQGGGPAVYIIRYSDDLIRIGDSQTDVTGGLAGVFGFAHTNGFFVEFKASAGRGPTLKFGIGFTVR